MSYKKTESYEDLYDRCLKVISGIKFTRRQIDIIACVVSGWNVKTIAERLSIAPSTVETHIDAVVQKVGYGGRRSILSFIEKSNKETYVRLYYQQMNNRGASDDRNSEKVEAARWPIEVNVPVNSFTKDKLKVFFKLAGLTIFSIGMFIYFVEFMIFQKQVMMTH